MSFAPASAGRGVSRTFTNLELNGGYDCHPDYYCKAVDLLVHGGARIKKSLCVEGNINVAGLISGQVCGNIFTAKITEKEPMEGIDVCGNILMSGDIIPSVDDQYVLGSPTNKWANIYAQDLVVCGELFANGIMNMVDGNLVTANIVCVLETLQTDLIESKTLNGNLCIQSNIDMKCGEIGNLQALRVDQVFGKSSPWNSEDDMNMRNGNAITFVEGIRIGNTDTTVSTSTGLAVGKGAMSSSTDSIAVGSLADAGSQGSISIGHHADTSSAYAIAIGSGFNAAGGPSATGLYTTAIGYNSVSDLPNSIAVGKNALASPGTVGNASAIGTDSIAGTPGSIAIGAGTSSTGTSYGGAVAIGSGAATDSGLFEPATTTSFATVALGTGSLVTNSFSIGIGNAHVSESSAVGIGRGVTVSGLAGVGLGLYANVVVDGGIALGRFSKASGGEYAIAIGGGLLTGQGADATAADTIAIGRMSTASDNNAIAIGLSSSALYDNAIAIGNSANAAVKAYAIAIGYSTEAIERAAIAVGENATAGNANTIAVGRNATASSDSAIAIGRNATASTENFAICIGGSSIGGAVGPAATGAYSICIGSGEFAFGEPEKYGPIASGKDAIAIGRGSDATANNSIALGKGAQATSANTISIGISSNATGVESISIGHNTVSLEDSIMIGESTGKNLTATSKNIAIGKQAMEGNTAGDLSTSTNNVAIGNYALQNHTELRGCIAIGYETMKDSWKHTFGIFPTQNVCVGHQVFKGARNPGSQNVAIGSRICEYDTGTYGTGTNNVLVGQGVARKAIYNIGQGHIMVGFAAMQYHGQAVTTGSASGNSSSCIGIGNSVFGRGMTGTGSIAIGSSALYGYYTAVRSSDYQIAIGKRSGVNLDTSHSVTIGTESGEGSWNLTTNVTDAYGLTAIGAHALRNIAGGTEWNCAVGYRALRGFGSTGSTIDVTGNRNTGMGSFVMANISSGSNNAVMGYKAGYSVTTGSNNIAIGSNADVSATVSYQIAIGNNATTSEIDAIAIGRPSPTSITANAEAWGQTFQSRSWAGGATEMAVINTFGDIQKGSTGNVCLDGNLIVKDTLFVSNIAGNSPVTFDDPIIVMGDVIAIGNISATKLQGVDVSTMSPSIGESLVFDGIGWAPGSPAAGVSSNVNANVVCANVEVQTNKIVPKTGGNVCVSGNLVVTDTLFVSNIVGNSPPTFDDGILLDAGESILFNTAIIIGNTTTTATASDGIAIGIDSRSTVAKGMAIGFGAHAYTGVSNMAIGNDSSATSPSGGLALGLSASASGSSATVIGGGASGMGTATTVIGVSASATGFSDTAIGAGATASSGNSVAIGADAEASLLTGGGGIAIGHNSYTQNKSTIAIGEGTDATVAQNIAIGGYAQATGNSFAIAIGGGTSGGIVTSATGQASIAIGKDSSSTALSTIAIGNAAVATAGNAIAIGASVSATTSGFFTIGLTTGPSGTSVYQEASGELRKAVSSIRYKKNISPLESSISSVRDMNPVRFEYKQNNRQDIGFIAEEMDKIYPTIVSKNMNGDIEGIQYPKITAILTKALQEALQKIDQLEGRITVLEK